MDFREMLESGAEKAGTTRALSQLIGVSESNISSAKSQGRGIPDKACVKLAQLLGIDALKVLAARNEWTAKTEEDREFWHPLANAAGIAIISIGIVTSFLLPSPAQAAPRLVLSSPTLCIMLNGILKLLRLRLQRVAIAAGNWRGAFGNYYSWDHTTP